MDKQTFLDRAALAYKIRQLRAQQLAYGWDCIDDIAVRLNAIVTYEDKEHIKVMWEIFESLGAHHELADVEGNY